MHATHYMPRLFCQRIWNKSGLALFAGSVVLATVTEVEESNTEIQREKVAAEEDLQVQQNASLLTAQQSALETELKKAQERVQLAEKNSDLSDPNAAPKAEALALIQTLDSSVQSAATTARPSPPSNSVPAAIELWNEENKGIGFAEATLVAVEANPAPKNDPLTPDQQPVKLVRINQSRSAVPLPTPSAVASREVQSLKERILEYHRLTMIAPQENSFWQMGTPDSTQTPVPALASEINRRPNAQANASPESSAHRHDSARMISPKILNIRHRSVVRSGFLDIKMRLIALRHQSLARSQRARSRTVLSNSNKDANKKADGKLTID
jgi:hypothetical protein